MMSLKPVYFFANYILYQNPLEWTHGFLKIRKFEFLGLCDLKLKNNAFFTVYVKIN